MTKKWLLYLTFTNEAEALGVAHAMWPDDEALQAATSFAEVDNPHVSSITPAEGMRQLQLRLIVKGTGEPMRTGTDEEGLPIITPGTDYRVNVEVMTRLGEVPPTEAEAVVIASMLGGYRLSEAQSTIRDGWRPAPGKGAAHVPFS